MLLVAKQTQKLGIEPRALVLETEMLPLHHFCKWQRRESNPHRLAYEASALTD